jgi:glycosyltransferase involved in cell wall biosynthesis
MKNKANILQVVNGFGIGGGELKLLELLKKLDKSKFNLVIVSVGQGGPLEDEFKALGWPVYVLPKAFSFDITLVFKLAKILKKHKIDLMMSTLFYADIIGALATLLYKPKAFVSWEVITGQLKAHQKIMYKLLSSRFDIVTAVSNSIHPFIRKDRGQHKDKIRTVYYGVDLEKYSTDEIKRNSQNIVFGSVARLVHQKGHTFLLEAIATVKSKYPNARWKFVGDGYKREELEQQADSLQIADVVEFKGSQANVVEQLATFDVFVLPSLWEGFPNVLLEAMAAGLPVIATSVEGTVELVLEEQTGLLVPKEDSHALALSMDKLLSQPELISQYGTAGQKRVKDHFSLQKQIMEFEQLYEELLTS